MMKRVRKSNGHKTRPVKKRAHTRREAREKTMEARERVLKEAVRVGVISNDRARAIGGWDQAWYHLHAMAMAGLLKRAGYNQWMPTAKRR
ncbi:MAG TPA: hypothetical protein VF077_03815 [Nitrospiraceae bacterium]